MLFRFRRWLKVSRYNREVKVILDTPPLRLDADSPYVLVSQICHFDVLMWIVAAKSWARFVPPKAVWVLDDGSLRPKDYALVRAHVPDVTIVTRSDVKNDRCPKGCFFERILLIADLAPDHYVMQLDSDTVTVSPPTEVDECIQRNVCFTLAGQLCPGVLPILEAQKITASQDWSPQKLQHEQVQSEIAFERLSNPESRRYVRGNAAFAGFAKGSISREDVETFSEEMEALLGERWTAWGTEQVTSNYLIANTDDPVIFREPRYSWHGPGQDLSETAFVHYIGTYRFDNGTYAAMSRKVAEELRAPAPTGS